MSGKSYQDFLLGKLDSLAGYVTGEITKPIYDNNIYEDSEDDDDDNQEENIKNHYNNNEYNYDNYTSEDDEEDTTDNSSNNYDEDNNFNKKIKNKKMIKILEIFIDYSSFSDINIPLIHLNHIIGKIHLCRNIDYEDLFPKEGIFFNIFGSDYIENFTNSIYITEGTFVVSRKLDYHYSYIINESFIKSKLYRNDNNQEEEYIDLFNEELNNNKLIKNDKLKRIIDNQEESIFLYQNDKNKNYKECRDRHDTNNNNINKLCPNEWLIYTNIKSEFFKCIREILKNDSIFNFADSSITNITTLSFQLVLFLCGDNEHFQKENIILNNKDDINNDFHDIKLSESTLHSERSKDTINIDIPHINNNKLINTNKYKGINDWVSLPSWFLPIYNAQLCNYFKNEI